MPVKRPQAISVYVGSIASMAAIALAIVALQADFDPDFLVPALGLSILFGFSEALELNFYEEKSRFGLSASEAIFLPMVFVLPLPLVVLGATGGMAFGRESRRITRLKGIFNVSQYGLASTAAAIVWAAASAGMSFSLRNVAAAVAAVGTFSFLTHVLTSAAIAITEQQPFVRLVTTTVFATLTSLVGSITLGLLFTAAYLTSQFTLVLFPLVLAVLFAGYRAMLRQRGARARTENVLSASRALAAGTVLEDALIGFLRSVQRVTSAAEAVAIVHMDEEHRWASVRGDTEHVTLMPVKDGPMMTLLEAVTAVNEPLVLTQDEQDSNELLRLMKASSLVAVPLATEGGTTGVLAAIDRIGADEFQNDDATLLAALGNELVLSLDAYRLFRQVAEERERFGRIFAGSTEGICLLDSEGVVQAWNPALEMISGYSADEVLGRVWSEVVFLRDVDQQRVEATALVVIPPDEELELVTRSGPTRWVSVLSGPVQATDGGGWVVLIRDVSAQHEVEQAKSDFLSTISHELRTPLTTIKGSLQVLERGPANLPGDLADQMIAVTTRGAERLERLVMNLLIVSQIESGTMPVFIDELVLQDIVRDKATSMLRDHPHSSVDVPDERLVVRADRERLGQVVEHLIDNAIKFGGPNGHVDVSMTRVNGYAQISVRDEGPGIPSADRDRIFERFVRLGDVLTRETQGAGVGLFIAKLSVEAMHGEIWVESEPGHGSTFHIKLPMARPMAVDFASA